MKPKLKKQNHPMQPIGYDEREIIRFKSNQVIIFLVDNLRDNLNINNLTILFNEKHFNQEDWDQFNQLLGLSVGAYCDFEGISKKSKNTARNISNNLVDTYTKKRID